MAFRVIVLLFIFSFCQNLWSKSDCFITQAMNDQTLMSDQKFWEEFSHLMDHGELNAESYNKLVSKFKKETPDSTESSIPVIQRKVVSTSTSRTTFETSKKADKDLLKLPKELVGKYEEFVTMVLSDEGVQGFYKNPGRWHIEKLKAVNSYTVRLNKGVRVEFTLIKGKVSVLQVNADHIHDI